MRRGLLKDIANTPTDIACGWRLYSDIKQLLALEGQVVVIDLLTGVCAIDDVPVAIDLSIAQDTFAWMTERFLQDAIPPELVKGARLILRPHSDRGLRVDCETIIETSEQSYRSAGTARWHEGDAR